jgi:hypothetical protein
MLADIPPERCSHIKLKNSDDTTLVVDSYKPSFSRNCGPLKKGDEIIEEGFTGYHPDDCQLTFRQGEFKLKIDGLQNLQKLRLMINFAIIEIMRKKISK